MAPEKTNQAAEADDVNGTTPEAPGWAQFMAQDSTFIQRLGKPALEELLRNGGRPTPTSRE